MNRGPCGQEPHPALGVTPIRAQQELAHPCANSAPSNSSPPSNPGTGRHRPYPPTRPAHGVCRLRRQAGTRQPQVTMGGEAGAQSRGGWGEWQETPGSGECPIIPSTPSSRLAVALGKTLDGKTSPSFAVARCPLLGQETQYPETLAGMTEHHTSRGQGDWRYRDHIALPASGRHSAPLPAYHGHQPPTMHSAVPHLHRG